MLSFTAVGHARVVRGEITVTWRLWKYAHVKAGGTYSTGFGYVDIEDVRLVRVADVSDADAREVGLADAAALIELARSHTGAVVSADTVLYRVQFRYRGEPPPRVEVSIEEITTRLERLDRASVRGPWTMSVLRMIEEEAGVPARVLANDLGFDTASFKVTVRKLKALGLTVSLDVGFELSALGQMYLDSVGDD